jgi:hypothetical protein
VALLGLACYSVFANEIAQEFELNGFYHYYLFAIINFYQAQSQLG